MVVCKFHIILDNTHFCNGFCGVPAESRKALSNIIIRSLYIRVSIGLKRKIVFFHKLEGFHDFGENPILLHKQLKTYLFLFNVFPRLSNVVVASVNSNNASSRCSEM